MVSYLLGGDRTVWLGGNFNFQADSNYVLTVSNLTDQALPPKPLSGGFTNVAFTFAAPPAAFYSFNAGVPDDVQVYGAAGVLASGSYDGSGYLRLTDAVNSQNGYALLTERRDVDQLHLHFKARVGNSGATPADGFSVNLAADLPTATFGTAEEGYLPAATQGADRLIIAFDNYTSSSADYSPSIAVKWRGVEVTNVLTGASGIPALSNTNGTWVDVDILLKRGGKISVAYDGVTVISQIPTGFDQIPAAQLGLAARTGGFNETHWFDDLSVNFAENDLGPVAVSPDSELGNIVAFENQLVRFAIAPTGAGPFRYQWYRDGVVIPGATARILSLVATTNITGHYHAVVQNEFSQATSAQGTLAVDTDYIAPTVTRIVGLASLNEIRVWFSEPVDPATATNLASYSVSPLTLLGATISTDGRLVILKTSPQVFEQNYTLHIAGVKDRAAAGNVLNGSSGFAATLSYPDEILADAPVRYYRLDETIGTTVASLVSVLDVLATTPATLANSPLLNQPALVPNAAGNGAIRFNSASSQRITVPNGADLNTTVGPWKKKTVEFWFNAASVPAPGTTGTSAAAGLFEQGAGTRSLNIYLWRNPANSDPAQADLVFTAWNNAAADGPGSPFGVPGTPVYVSTPVTTGVIYHVVAVFDGSTNTAEGQLILYLNGVEADRVSGAGQLYNHTSDIQIGRGNTLLHTSVNTTAVNLPYFSGTVDEVSLYNTALSAGRVATHYQIANASVAPPQIRSIASEAGDLVIRWEGGAHLQRATNAAGPWLDVNSATSPYQVVPGAEPAAFFRLVK